MPLIAFNFSWVKNLKIETHSAYSIQEMLRNVNDRIIITYGTWNHILARKEDLI